MKTYTITWLQNKFYKDDLCRLIVRSPDPLDFFLFHALGGDESAFCLFYCGAKNFRLTRCGKLVARVATYQGV